MDPKKSSQIFDSLLDWTNKQGRILTAEGKYLNYYTEDMFQESELPHYHLDKGTTHEAFEQFGRERGDKKLDVCGAWTRPLFLGEWEHSTGDDERVFNVQTNTLFVDIRIPVHRDACLKDPACDEVKKVRILSRQHAFAGFTVQSQYQYKSNKKEDRNGDDVEIRKFQCVSRTCCTRHHCIDWNYVPNCSQPRPRPNKWFVEMRKGTHDVWKEWAFGKNGHGQHYYMERWERLDSNENKFILALRKKRGSLIDGVLVIVGDHCNYIHGRTNTFEAGENLMSTVGLVDMSLENRQISTARSYIDIEAGHVSMMPNGKWYIDCCTVPEKEGKLMEEFRIVQKGELVKSCLILWPDSSCEWEILECSSESIDDLKAKLFIETLQA